MELNRLNLSKIIFVAFWAILAPYIYASSDGDAKTTGFKDYVIKLADDNPELTCFAVGALAGASTTAAGMKGTIAGCPFLYTTPVTAAITTTVVSLVGTGSSMWAYDTCIQHRNERVRAERNK